MTVFSYSNQDALLLHLQKVWKYWWHYLMKYAFLSFAYRPRDANFVRLLTASSLLSFWGLQLMDSDTLLSPSSLQGLVQKDFDVDVRSEHIF